MTKTSTVRRRKKVRLEDVARVAAISPGTASMALAGSTRVSAQTRKRVIEACKSLDYQTPRTARRTFSGKQPRAGLVCIGGSASSPPHSHLLHPLTHLAHQHRYRLEVASIESTDPHTQLQQIIAFAQPCDGILLTGSVSAKLLRLLDEAGITAASMDLPRQDDPPYTSPSPEAGKAPAVPAATESDSDAIASHLAFRHRQHHAVAHGVVFCTDDRAMAMHATRTLLAQGHRHIAFVSENLRPDQGHHRWFEGYELALLEAGITPEPDLLAVVGRTQQMMHQAVARLAARKHPPTAAVVVDLVLVSPLTYELQAVGINIAPNDMMLWGCPELASLYRLNDRPLLSADLTRWAQAGLSFAISPPEAKLPSGSQVYVPWQCWNMPAVNKPAQSKHQSDE